MNRSYLGGFLVKLGPTKVALVIILFHCFAAQHQKKNEDVTQNLQMETTCEIIIRKTNTPVNKIHQ